jgi:hypothetical protein
VGTELSRITRIRSSILIIAKKSGVGGESDAGSSGSVAIGSTSFTIVYVRCGGDFSFSHDLFMSRGISGWGEVKRNI